MKSAYMIERYRLNPTTLHLRQYPHGQAEGWEFEAEYLSSGLEGLRNLSAVRGRSLDTGAALNDIPPLRLYAGTRIWLGWISAEANGVFLLEKATRDRPKWPSPVGRR